MTKFINPDGDWQNVGSKATKQVLGPNMAKFITKLSNELDVTMVNALNHAAREIEMNKGRFAGDEKSTIFLGLTDILAIVLGSLFTDTLAKLTEKGAPDDVVKRAQKAFRRYSTEEAQLVAIKARWVINRKVH